MRYWLDTEGPDPKAIGKALLWLIKGTPSGTTSILAVPGLDTLMNGTIEALIGPGPAKNLAKGGVMTLPSGGSVTAMTERKTPSGWEGGPVLAAYPTKRLLDMIDDLPLVTDVFVVPWVKDEVSGWVKKWGASEYEGAHQPSETLPCLPT